MSDGTVSVNGFLVLRGAATGIALSPDEKLIFTITLAGPDTQEDGDATLSIVVSKAPPTDDK